MLIFILFSLFNLGGLFSWLHIGFSIQFIFKYFKFGMLSFFV